MPATLGSIALVVAIGCEAAPAPLPILTDPTAVLVAGLESTAALHGVHLRVEVAVDMPNGGGTDSQTMEIDVDLDTRSFAGRSAANREDGTAMTNDIIATGGMQYTRFEEDARWMAMPAVGRAPVPPNGELVRLVAAILARDTVNVRLAEPVACSDSTCYHVVVDVDALAASELLVPIVNGGAGGPAEGNRPIAATSFDVFIDQPTRRLIAANTTFRFDGTAFRLAIVLSHHDLPVQIVPPPPGQVENAIDNIGGGAVPAPTAFPPSAAESP